MTIMWFPPEQKKEDPYLDEEDATQSIDSLALVS
jgi:hypothetical protein